MLEGKYVEIEGMRLYYEKYSTGSDKSIVLIHTAGTDGRMWREFAELLSKNYTIYVPDLPGHGKSDSFPRQETIGIKIEDYANIIKKFLEELNLMEVIVIGCSIGGDISLLLSSIAQDRLSLSIVVEAAAITETFTPEQLVAIDPSDTFKTYSYCGRNTKKDRIEHIIWIKSTNNPKIYLQDLKAWNSFDVRKTLGNIEIQTILIRGIDDPFITTDMIKITEKFLKNSKTINLEGFGHYPMTEDPEAFANFVIKSIK